MNRSTSRSVLAGLVVAGGLALAGCATGQVAQTAQMSPTVDGQMAQVGSLAIRNVLGLWREDAPLTRWFISRGFAQSDDMAVEVLPNPDRGVMMPVHQHVLAEAGVYLIENLALDEIARARLTGFCFILLATKYKGATGCPVRPVALV